MDSHHSYQSTLRKYILFFHWLAQLLLLLSKNCSAFFRTSTQRTPDFERTWVKMEYHRHEKLKKADVVPS